jgi:NAD(P)-dependent dehydrogenase (short-subunit alcohol dehydrogenase family)
MSNSKQKTVVVTGASSGFGLDTARRFSADGWSVYATVRNSRGHHSETVSALEREGIHVVDLEVTDQASVDRAAAEILAAGPVDVLVNNAGAAFFGVVEAYTPEAIARQYDVNVFGPMRVSRAFLPSMRERADGLVVYVSSIVGRFPMPFGGVYASSKAALESLAEASSYELGPLGVDIAIVQPGAYQTNIANSRGDADDASRLPGYGKVLPLAGKISEGLAASSQGRESKEVADAILSLANLPHGERPLRTAVPNDEVIAAYNDAVAPIQRGFMQYFGLDDLLAKVPATS